MPELRKDPVIGRWVIIATERARRPGIFIKSDRSTFDAEREEKCIYCGRHDDAVLVIPSNKKKNGKSPWSVAVVTHKNGVLSLENKFKRWGHGLYDLVNGYGVNEMVIETPEHIANMADLDAGQIRMVIDAYVQRINELEKIEDIKYVLPMKNYGTQAGARNIGHSRSEIIASPINPLSVKEKLKGAKQYYDLHDRCLYCDVVKQDGETGERVITQTEHFLAVAPFASRFPFEVWVIPKEHDCDFARGVIGQEDDLAKILKEVLLKIKVGLDNPSYNYVFQTAPFRREFKDGKWETIEEDYHWHIEVMPRLTHVAGFEKGSGFYICPIPPEDTAEFLREVEL